jgi:hypothetical protein
MATYQVTAPNGKTYRVEGPPGASQEEVIRAVLALKPEAGARPPEPTFFGQVGEAFKGLVPGAVGLVESAAIGASALLPEEQESAAREAIARIAGAAKAPFAPAPGYEQTVGRKLGEAVGSTGPFLAAGPLGLAGRIGATALGVGAGAGEARTRAETEGATAEQRGTATALGTIPGALEIFAPFRILSRIPEGEVLTATARVKRAFVAGGEEAAQEAASGLAQNLIARGVYKPEQALIEGLGEQAAYGGATGAIVQGLMDLALGRRARGAGAEPSTGELAPIDVRRQEAARAEAEKAAKTAPAQPTTAPPPPESAPGEAAPGEAAPSTVLDDAAVRALGFAPGKGKRKTFYDKLVNKDLSNPKDVETVRSILENFVEKARNQGPELKGAALKAAQFLETLPAKETPKPTEAPKPPAAVAPLTATEATTPTVEEAAPVAETITVAEPITTETPSASNVPTEPEPSGAGVPVAGGPAAVSPAQGTGATEPVRVVPPVEDVGQPPAGEGQQPPAVTPPSEAPAPKPAAPKATERATTGVEYTEEDIDRAVEAGLFTEEQAEVYRAELRGEEAPQTAMGLAFERRVADLKAQIDALKQKNGRAPAPKSKNRAKYDELKAQLDTLLTSEKGDLVDRLEKMGASGVLGARGERPVIDLDAVKENLLKARAEPGMYQAVLAYIGVDAEGNYLPTTYSREEAAELAGMERSSGANVSRVAQAMGIDAEAVSRFHAGQTDIIVRGKNVSEAGTGATDLKPTRGVLYEAPKGKKKAKVADLLKPALTETGTLDFSGLTDKQVADIYARASNYDPSKGNNRDVIKQLNEEIAVRTKKDRKSMQSALDRAYKFVRKEEEAALEEEETERAEDEATEPIVREGKTGARRFKGEEKTSLEDEDVRYRTIPQTPLVQGVISDAQLRKIVADIEKALGGNLDITVLDDVTDIDNKQVAGSRAGAVIRGKVYLFRSGIKEGIEGQKTIFHEVFHKGLANLLSPAEYRALMTKFYNQSAAMRQAADDYLTSETGKKDTKGMSREEAQVLAVEEALAEIAEQTKLTGSMLRQLGNFFARLAERIGMPNLARAIRTMGLDPLQAFIREAIQAGIGSGGVGVARFRTVTPQTEAATAGVNAIGKESKKSLADLLRRNPALAARIKATDYLAGLDDIFTKAYAGKVRDATGNLNPMVLISRALDHGRVSLEAMRTGGLKIKDGLVQAAELTVPEDSKEFPFIAGKTISYQKDVIERLAKEAEKAGTTYEKYRTQVDTVLYGHREYYLREHNREVEKQALALEAAGKTKEADQLREDQTIELLIKDDAKLDALEAEFQRNKDIQEISQTLDAIRFNNLDVLVETNRLSPEKAQEYKDNIGYIPFKRIVEYEAGFDTARGGNRGIAALKNIRNLEGSSRESLSVIENFAGFMDWSTREAMLNNASLSALKDMELLKLAKKGANNEVGATGANVKVYDKGEKVEYYVPDPAHVIAFTFQPPELSSVFKKMQTASNILRAGVTSMPPFAVKQIFDDIARAYAYSGVKNPMQLTARILTSFPANWYREAFGKKQNATVREMAKLGIFGTFDFTKGGNLRDILEEAGAEGKSVGKTIMRFMEAGAKASDVSVRQAIYEQVLKETGDAAAAESRAREIINFSRRGSANFMNTMIAIVPFFNAYARGMDKLAVAAAGKAVGQSVGQARAMFYKRMGVMTAMGLAYALMMSDDDEYNALPDHVRDTNWILPYGKDLGFTPAIPIPAELAFFFKAIPERVVRYYKLQGTDEEKAAIEVVGNLLKRGVDVFSSPNVTPQLLRPFVENITNYSWFLGRPLESQGQLALDPFQRFGTGTSDTAKEAAKKLEDLYQTTGVELFRVSPIKIENAIRGILGTTAGVALAMTDAFINPTRTDRPLHQMLAAQLTGASAVMKDAVGTRYLDEVYDLEKDVNRVNSTYNRMLEREPENADEYLRKNVGLFSIRPAVSSLMKTIKELNNEAALVDRTTEIDEGERRMLINQLRAQQNEIAQQVGMLRTQARKIQQGM